MKKEVRRKSGFIDPGDLSDEDEELPAMEPTRKKKKKSSMFRTNTDTVWTDEDLDTLHGDMKQEFERLISLSQSESQSNPRGLGSTASMSISRGPGPQIQAMRTLDSAETIELDEVSATPLAIPPDQSKENLDEVSATPLAIPPDQEKGPIPGTTPKNVGGVHQQEEEEGADERLPPDQGGSIMLKSDTDNSMKDFVSIDSDMTVYNSVEIFKQPSTGGAEIEKKRSARDGLENPPLTQKETNDPTTRGRQKSTVAVESTQLSL